MPLLTLGAQRKVFGLSEQVSRGIMPHGKTCIENSDVSQFMCQGHSGVAIATSKNLATKSGVYHHANE